MYSHEPIWHQVVRIAVFLLALGFASNGASQATPDSDSPAPQQEYIEEIVVYGEMNLIQLRHEMYRVEEHFLDVFNSINTVAEFRFKCGYETVLSTGAKAHVCKPRYFDKLEAASWRSRMMSGIGIGSTLGQHEYGRQIQRKDEQLVAIMLRLISENPALRDAYNELDRVRHAYEQRQNERRK